MSDTKEGWFLPRSALSDLAVQSLESAIATSRGGRWANLIIRYEGREIIFEADWVKYLVPHRKDLTPS